MVMLAPVAAAAIILPVEAASAVVMALEAAANIRTLEAAAAKLPLEAATTILSLEAATTILSLEAASATVMAVVAAAIRTLKALMRPIVAGLALRRAAMATKVGVLAAADAIIVVKARLHSIVASRSVPRRIMPPGALPLPRIVALLLAESGTSLSIGRSLPHRRVLAADSHSLSLTIR